MPTRSATAEWKGGLKGQGEFRGQTGLAGQYNFSSRFENGVGTNPEELLGASHAACFSMALSAGLGKAGFTPQRVSTTAKVTVDKVGEGFKITKIVLQTEASIPNIVRTRLTRSVSRSSASSATGSNPSRRMCSGGWLTSVTAASATAALAVAWLTAGSVIAASLIASP